jgi:LPXTG-motif cell wall-anchored protein
VSAWIQANKDVIEVFLDVDVDSCKGLNQLDYAEAVALADLEGVDLEKLAKASSPDEILAYADRAGITLNDVERFLNRFCAGEVPIPSVPASETPGDDSATPSGDASASAGSGTASEGPSSGADPRETPSGAASASEEDPDGSLAHTGSSSPLVPLGIGAGALGLGGGALYLARRRGVI